MFSAIGAVSFVLVFAQWLLQLLYHTNSNYNALVIQLCLASFPAYCLVHVYGSVLTGAGRLNQFIKILFITVAVNMVSNLMLIPAYGALGSCIAALASQYFCGTATMFMATKKLHISYSGQSMLVYLVTAILLTALFYFGKHALINVWSF
jgi:O-antigen/teichoic acid export membrane protein